MATFLDPNTASGQRRFWYISGLTSDEFYTDSCMLLNLTQFLFHELKDSGYEKIVFYNARKKLYCFDEKSYTLLTGTCSKLCSKDFTNANTDKWSSKRCQN